MTIEAHALIAVVQASQLGLLRLLHAVGLAADVDGQPAWPFARRVAIETLAIDAGLVRQLAIYAGTAALVATLLLVGAAWRRVRRPAWATGLALVLALVLLAPWPDPALLLTDAVPTSFHRAPTVFDADAIVHGLAVYQARCASCHGTDGRGETARAATLPVWPPRLTGGLLSRRADGELLWRIRHGVGSMPGDADAIDEADAWSVLQGVRALAAGESARREGLWQWPVRAPDMAVRCENGTVPRLSGWRGQRLRIVVAGRTTAPVGEDPRFVTVVLSAGAALTNAPCAADSPAALQAYATIAGLSTEALAGTQFIVDRDGWLRAVAPPGDDAWSPDRLLCRSKEPAPLADTTAGGTGLDRLIQEMDADPVRVTAIGFAHGG